MVRALSVGQVIAGEAVSGSDQERFNDMVAIASVIANRAAMLGITPQEVIANTNEFNAYNRPMPAGTPDLVDMANEAMRYVELNGPVNNATFYATPAAVDNLPSGLSYETATTGHQYFSDPQNRAIGSALGYRQPNQYSWAANPENVPTPSMASLMGPTGDLGNTWTINGVAPAQFPAIEGWTEMAAAGPFQSPIAPQSSPLQNSFADLAAAGPFQSPLSSVTPDTANFDMARFGPAPSALPDTSNFDMSRFGPVATPDTASFDPGRFGPIDTASFDPNRFGPPSIDPATNTASFMGAPPADLGSFPAAMAANRTHMGTGVYSPQHQQMQAQVEKQLENARLSSSPLSAFAAQPSVTPAEAAIQSVTTPNPANLGSFPSAISAQRALPGYHLSELDGVTYVKDDVAAPKLETVSVAEQPTIAGPASTEIAPAQQQQQVAQNRQAVTQQATQAAPSKSPLSGMLNKGTIAGGALGGLVAGPFGGILGALLGNAINNGGLSPGQQPTGGFLGYGPAAVAAAANGSAPAGSYGFATDGSRVTSQGNGWSTRTNAQGVTTSTSPWGGGAGWFGGDPNDPESYT